MNQALIPILILLVLAVIAAISLFFLLLKTRKDSADSESRLKTASEGLKKLASDLDDKNKELESKLRSIQGDTKKASDETGNLIKDLEKVEKDLKKVEKENNELKLLVEERDKQIVNLKAALKPDSFDGLFPICSNCKDIRDPKGYWHSIEEYIQGLSKSDFSHSLCPVCAKKLYPDLFDGEKKAIILKWNPGSDKPL